MFISLRSLRAAAVVAVLVTIAASALAAPLERQRAFFRDRWVNYIEKNGLAITEGDIVLGTAGELKQMRADTTSSLKALIIDQSQLLWPIGPSGVHEVPYIYEAGSEFNVEAAVVLFNATFRDTIRFVRRTTQKDYVTFRLEGPDGSCFSYIGRIGGKQQIGGAVECPVGSLLHEMGHAIGFWHVQSDAAQGSYLNIRYDIMDPVWRSQYVPELGARTVDGYDYASIMHYGPFVSSTSPDPLTASTMPPGIDIGERDEFSAADIDAVKRLYGQVPVAVTITTNPPGLKVKVDGVERYTPSVQIWRLGSLHRIDTPAGVQDYGLYKVAFGRWNHDASASPKSAQEWIVEPGRGFQGEPNTSPRTTVLTANFVRLVDVQTTVVGGEHGQLTVTSETPAWPGTTNFYPQYTKFDFLAKPAEGYLNTWITSPTYYSLTGGTGGVPTASRRIAQESPVTIGARFVAGPGIVVKTAGTGVDGSLRADIREPGTFGQTRTRLIPAVLQSAVPGKYRITADGEQYRTDTVRFISTSIDGVDENGEVAAPRGNDATTVVTINFQKQFGAVGDINPSCGGSLEVFATEEAGGPFVVIGSKLTAIAKPVPGVVFAGWEGTVSGLATTATMTADRVPELYANFNAIAEPFKVTRISPASYTYGQGPVTFEFTGTGFSSKTFVLFANGGTKAGQLVNSRTFRVTLSDSDFATSGKVVLSLGSVLTPSCAVFGEPMVVDVTPKVTPKLVTVHEFYNPTLDRYFYTANENEARAIQINPFSSERASGNVFKAWETTAFPDGASIVYRFYGSIDPGPNGHFLTANANEARQLQRAELDTPATSKRWNYEEMSFAIKTPAANFTCPADAPVKVYRAYNNGFARGASVNHRLVTDTTLYAEMIGAGWIGEGVVMCGPQ